MTTRGLALLAAFVATVGCAHVPSVTLTKELPLYDRSAVKPLASTQRVSSVMVVPPSGSDSSRYESQISSLEAELMRNGVRVISGAVTGRAIECRSVATARLTDLERALVMARETGADAILQIESLGVIEKVASRYIVLERGADEAQEVGRDDFAASTGAKAALSSGALHLVGRLIDVADGELLAAIDLACPFLWSLPYDLKAEAWTYAERLVLQHPNLPMEGTRRWDSAQNAHVTDLPEWEPYARNRCGKRIIDRLIAITLGLPLAPLPRSALRGGAVPVLEL